MRALAWGGRLQPLRRTMFSSSEPLSQHTSSQLVNRMNSESVKFAIYWSTHQSSRQLSSEGRLLERLAMSQSEPVLAATRFLLWDATFCPASRVRKKRPSTTNTLNSTRLAAPVSAILNSHSNHVSEAETGHDECAKHAVEENTSRAARGTTCRRHLRCPRRRGRAGQWRGHSLKTND